MLKMTTILAFIKQDRFKNVLLDIIEVSKKDTPYHYKDKVWNRKYPDLGLGHSYIAKDKRFKLSPLPDILRLLSYS